MSQRQATLHDEHIDLLSAMVVDLRARLATAEAERDAARAALTTIAGILLRRHQEGWEERLYDIARNAMGDGKP